ncbi:MAG: tyrosine-type recombinase/integrase [Candidatus Bathyarchaeia archaeon]
MKLQHLRRWAEASGMVQECDERFKAEGSASRPPHEKANCKPQSKPQPKTGVEQEPTCPLCGSKRIYKDGLRYTANGPVQRFLCRFCGYRFSESKVKFNVSGQIGEVADSKPELLDEHVSASTFAFKEEANPLPLQRSENVASHVGSFETVVGKGLYALPSYNRKRRVCGKGDLPKNSVSKAVALAEGKTAVENGLAGATWKQPSTDVKGEIIEYCWWLKKQGYSDVTIRVNASALKTLAARGADLNVPETVKEVIARQKWSEARKHGVIAAYTLYAKMHGYAWNPPKCVVTRKLPFIPTEQELDALIAACGRKTAAFLQLLKETAMRCGEAIRLKWVDVDFERQTITLNSPEKGSKARVWKVSRRLIEMLSRLPRVNEYVFGGVTVQSLKSSFWNSRKRAAWKLQNPRLNRISFHTFRHWKATMLYHQTKDPLLVKEFLGHRKLDSTLFYIQLEQALFKEADDEFTVKTASTPDEIKALLEVGFEYVCSKDGLLFFRKRK